MSNKKCTKPDDHEGPPQKCERCGYVYCGACGNENERQYLECPKCGEEVWDMINYDA